METKFKMILFGVLSVSIVLLVLTGNCALDSRSVYFGFIQNLSSDLIVGVGIVTAISIYYSTQQAKKEKVKRKDEILRLLLQELNENLSNISDNEKGLEGDDYNRWKPCLPGLKNEMWQAISEGGEIKWLDDNSLGLLNHISIVYHYISSIKRLEFEFSHELLRHKARGTGYEGYMKPAIIDGYEKIRKYILKVIEEEKAIRNNIPGDD